MLITLGGGGVEIKDTPSLTRIFTTLTWTERLHSDNDIWLNYKWVDDTRAPPGCQGTAQVHATVEQSPPPSHVCGLVKHSFSTRTPDLCGSVSVRRCTVNPGDVVMEAGEWVEGRHAGNGSSFAFGCGCSCNGE